MVTYMQIQNFVVSQMLGDSKILNVIKDSFEKYCKSKNLKVLNIFSEKFHNGRFSKKKADSIRVFNEYVKTDDRLGNLFSGYYGCTKLFYDFATTQSEQAELVRKKREFYIDFILDFDDIVNYIERISPKIANNISKLNIEASFNKKFNPYLSLIEEYYILNLETNNPIIFNNLKRK